MRRRRAGELEPTSAVHSGTWNDKTEFEANNAIDLDLMTASKTAPDEDKNSWFKVTLGKVYCIGKVMRYDSNGKVRTSWFCSRATCSCKGYGCNSYNLGVKITESADDSSLTHGPDCIYGDDITIERIRSNSYPFKMYEIAIKEMQGEIILGFTKFLAIAYNGKARAHPPV